MASSEIKFVCRDEVSKPLEESINDLRYCSLPVPDSSFHPSQITECPRRLIYRVNGAADKIVGENIYQSIQDETFKNKWITLLEKVKFVKVLHKNAIASDCNYNLFSKVDAVINIKGDIFAVKAIHTCGLDEMEEIRNKGAMKKHVIEMVLYIWLLEVDGGILIYDSDYGHCMFHIKPYKPIVESVIEKCRKLCDFKLAGQIPNRPYKSKAKECSDCEYRCICWENKKEGQ